MKFAYTPPGTMVTCSKETITTLNALNEKVNAEFGSKPFNRMAFNQMLASMGRWLSDMFPEIHVPEITGSYVIETGVVDLPNLVPVIEKIVQERKAQETRTLYPTKGDTAPMSQPITEQDVADYLEKFIQTSELVPDQMKALFIGRVTNWGNPVGAHPVTQESTEKLAPSAEVARMPDTTKPLTMSITRDDDGHMCIAIADRKWKIMRHGIIGNGAADRDDFHRAASELVDNALPFSDAGIERTIRADDLISAQGESAKYRLAMLYRSKVDRSLGEVAYSAYCDSLPSSEAKQPEWSDVVYKFAWESAANASYLSVGLHPNDINKEIQIVAARKRLQLLRSPFLTSGSVDTVAANIAAIAGPTPQT